MPLISALIGAFNFSVNQGVLSFSWEALWTQESLFLGVFFLSPLIAAFCSLLWRMEHQGTNWNILRVLESPGRILMEKLLAAWGICALCILWIGALFFGSGVLLGLPGELPGGFSDSMLCALFACMAIASMQMYLSLVIRSFAVSVGIALGGGLGGILFLARGWGYAMPYALLQTGLKSTNLTGEIRVPLLILVCVCYMLLFCGLSVLHIRRREL